MTFMELLPPPCQSDHVTLTQIFLSTTVPIGEPAYALRSTVDVLQAHGPAETALGGFGAKQSVPPAHAARPLICVLSRANSFDY